jgi:hypothetical protein
MPVALQSRFAAALIDRDRPTPLGLVSWSGGRPDRRFELHRNNFAAGLAKALAARFPATERIVGEEFFAAMARDFAVRHPPTSPVLLEYGAGFADFVENFELAGDLPYLSDVVRLEDARARAYHAPDATPLALQELSNLSAETLADVAFAIHPAVQVVRSNFPIVTIWAMNAGDAELGPIHDWRGEDALVARPELKVFVHRLPAGGATFLERLCGGCPLAAAVEGAANEAAEFDLTLNLAGVLSAGVIVGVGTKTGDGL